MHRFEDPRVDVAVYFIAPHRLKQMDCEFMSELAKCVPVLPVLAKVRSYVHSPWTSTLTLTLLMIHFTALYPDSCYGRTQAPSSAGHSCVLMCSSSRSTHEPVNVGQQADTMTSSELAEYRREVRGALIHAGKQAGQDIIHRHGCGHGKVSFEELSASGSGSGSGFASASGTSAQGFA